MRIIYSVVCIAIISSCTSDYDLPVPHRQKQIVLNGILNPDSILKVKLTFSQEITDTSEPENIEDATVRVVENGTRFIELRHNGDGQYTSEVRVQKGFSYHVLAEVRGYPVVEAEDIVPDDPVVSTCYSQRSNRSGNYDVQVNLYITNDQNAEHRYWFDMSAKGDYIQNSSTELKKLYYLTCADLTLDNFNSSYDNTFQEFYYTLYMRQSDESKMLHRFPLAITGAAGHSFFKYENLQSLAPGQGLFVTTYNCSRAYDQYLKSSLIQFINNNLYDMPNPLSGPVKIFSNVENGIGIFAAYSIKTLEVNKYPCN